MKSKLYSRTLAVLLSLMLIVGLTPTMAFAANGNAIHVGGSELTGNAGTPVYALTTEDGAVTTENATADNYNIKWDGSTLTLKDATLTKGCDEGDSSLSLECYAIHCENDFTIELEGKNTVESPDVNSTDKSCASIGIFAEQKLTITGDGVLDITGGEVKTEEYGKEARSIGIYAYGITISSGTVTATGSAAIGVSETFSYGISSYGDVKVENATVTAKGKDANCSAGINIANGDITIESGSVTASGGRSNPSASAGIRAESGSVTINGGEVSAAVDLTEGGNADGIYAYGDIAINGGKINSIGACSNADGVDPDYSSGIFSETGDITITGKDTVVNASGGFAGDGITAIAAKAGDIVIRGGMVYADAASAGSEHSNIKFGNGLSALKDSDNTGGNIIISGGTVSVIGYTDSLYYEGELIARPENGEITAGVLKDLIFDEVTGRPDLDKMAASASLLEGSPFTSETVIARSLTEGKLYFDATYTATAPTDPTDPTDPSTPAGSGEQNGDADKDDNSPQTGDDSNIALWLAMLLASGTALTGTVLYNRKKKYIR